MGIIKCYESVEKPGLFSSSKEPIADSDTCFVYVNNRGKHQLVGPGDQMSNSSIKAHNYTTRVSVCTLTHLYKHSDEYQSKEHGKPFKISLQMEISVEDPIRVVQNDIDDVEEYVDRKISYWLETLAGEHSITEHQLLRDKAYDFSQHTEMVKELERVGFFVDKIRANVSLGEDELEFLREREAIKRQAQLDLERKKQEELLFEIERKRKEEEEERQRAENERLRMILKEHGPEALALEITPENSEKIDILLEEYRENRKHIRTIEEINVRHSNEIEHKAIETRAEIVKMVLVAVQKGELDGETGSTILKNLNDSEQNSQPTLTNVEEPRLLEEWKNPKGKKSDNDYGEWQ